MVAFRPFLILVLVFSLASTRVVADPPEGVVPPTNGGSAAPAPVPPPEGKNWGWLGCKWVWAAIALPVGGFLLTYYATDNLDNLRGKAELKTEHEKAILETRDLLREAKEQKEAEKLGGVLIASGEAGKVTPAQLDEAKKAVQAARDTKDSVQPIPALVRNKITDLLKVVGEKPDSQYGKDFLDAAQKEFNRLANLPDATQPDGDQEVYVKLAGWMETRIAKEKDDRDKLAEQKRIQDLIQGGAGRKK